METDEPLHKDFLLLPSSGKLLKKSWQRKYCLLFKSSKFGIGRLEIYEAESKTGQPKIITLENVVKITPKASNTFGVLTKTAEHDFGTVTEESLNDWIRAIQNVAFPDEVSHFNSIEEDNDLYCSTDEGVFYVKLHPSDASERCKLPSKNYTLVLTPTKLQLRNEGDNKLLYTWPYCYIRRYGYKNGKFTFEAGRKCESGEGTFFLEHPHQHEIYRCLASKMKSMKKLLSESTSSLLDPVDLQLHAALSMEARSRSPLPPSPTTMPSLHSSHSSFHDSKLSFRSHLSLSSTESQNIVKPMPRKPPRKAIPPKTLSLAAMSVGTCSFSSDSDYQPINIGDKYDLVVKRTEAWKTMGVEAPNHTEKISSDCEEDDCLSWSSMKKAINEVQPIEMNLAPAVITEPTISLDGQYYDHLNFFGSSSKLNGSSGYNQVIPPPLPPVSAPQTVNHYDEVQCIEPARLADDSHLGYALIRKDTSGSLKEVDKKEQLTSKFLTKKEKDKISHQFHNEDPYAIVSKPKHV